MAAPRFRNREKLLLYLALIFAVLLILRTGQVQIVQHRAIQTRATLQQTDTLVLAATRGALRDRNGTVLAQSVENPSVWADPRVVEAPAGLDLEMAALGWTKPGDVIRLLDQAQGKHFIWLYRGWTTDATVVRMERAWKGVAQRPEPKRLYPLGSVLGALLGKVGTDAEHLSGLELQLDGDLRGRTGRELRFVTGGKKPTTSLPPTVLEPPLPGRDVWLTLDLRAQEIAVRRLEEGLLQWNARAAFALILDPMTGEILAAAAVPHPDPARRRKEKGSPWRIRPFTDQWEPGSTFKVLTFAAALETSGLSLDDVYDCENGLWVTKDWRIKDHEPYGLLTARDVLVHSSNVGAAKIALRVGPEAFYRYVRNLGFGMETGVQFPLEAKGRVRKPEEWQARSLPTMGFGQEISVSSLQLGLLFAALANGGNLMQPTLVREVRDGEGRTVERFAPRVVRRVFDTETCRQLVRIMRDVVVEGTGTLAEIAWFPPAGKTGTAQLYDPDLEGYSREDYMASFIGFAPWDEPRYLCLVVLDSPRGSIYGGQTAAPIFKKILEDLTAARGVLAGAGIDAGTPEPSSRTVPDVKGLSPDEARRILKARGFVPVLEGRGLRVQEIDPAPGTLAESQTVVRLFPGAMGEGAQAVPDLVGWPVRKALVALSREDLTWRIEGDGWIERQAPAAGEPRPSDGVVGLVASRRLSHAWDSWETTWRTVTDAAAWGHVEARP